MRALVVTHGDTGPVRFGEVGEPVPAPHEVLVEVRHIGLNFGELKHAGQWPAGVIHGHDAAGVVLRAAADGTGPAEGTRVALGQAPYAWAQRVAVAPAWLGVVPDRVDLADAAAIGVAGIAALRALRSRSILARRVLVTGASGGVGRFAVQLAAIGGAHVSALVGAPGRAAGLRELGAVEVATDISALPGPFDLVIDTVAGPQLATVWDRLAVGGDVQLVGSASGRPTTFPANSLFSFGDPKTLTTFGDVVTPVSTELADLLALLESGRLSAEVSLRAGWDDIDRAIRALFAREVRGKIVLDVSRD